MSARLFPPLASILVTLCLPMPSEPSQETPIYFGNLHSHTSYSDGMDTPKNAYQKARAAGLDFLAITEHNHREAELGAEERADTLLIATKPELYQELILRASQATQNGQFVALYGQEFSSISKGNHVNVFDVDTVISDSEIPNGEFKPFWEQWLPAHPDSSGQVALCQFNHPDVAGDLRPPSGVPKVDKTLRNDYGYDEYGESFPALRDATRSAVRLIEVVSGPATKPTFSTDLSRNRHQGDYLHYLAHGFRLAPTANQDNHYFSTMGSSSHARTAVLSPSLTRLDLLTALKARRCYATEDSDLRLRFTINGHPMGSMLNPVQGELDIRVSIQDPTDNGATYEVALFQGMADGQPAAVVEKKPLQGAGQVVFDAYQATGSSVFYFAKVVQTTSSPQRTDYAWSAPIWLDAAEAPAPLVSAFAWSRNSVVYHFAQCKTVATIRPENLETGTAAPEGKRLHQGCPR
jgi:hypothetical protein